MLIALAFSCSLAEKKEELKLDSNIVQGDLVIMLDDVFIPVVDSMKAVFAKEYPHVNIVSKALGSRRMAQDIANGKTKADIFISTDYRVIENLLMPVYTSWYLKFAQDEMVIAYTNRSKYANTLSADNWYRIFLRDDVHFGRTDPDYAPVGYRAVMLIKLSENYYGEDGIRDHLLFKDKAFITKTESELFPLLKDGKIDYIFTYRSVAEQYKLQYLRLPEQLNLASEEMAPYYSMARVKVDGARPGKYILRQGRPTRYGLCLLKAGPNPKAAREFFVFFAENRQGRKIMKENHITMLQEITAEPLDSVPEDIREMVGL